MCGLTGYIDLDNTLTADAMRELVRGMASTLARRGPDDAGEWVDPDAGIALGFRRLAIVDLSPAGHQPMESASGRYVIAFNGEVYNFDILRRELREQGRNLEYRGHSDTEVMLAAIEIWGLVEAVKRFVGMFAFALWDRKERTLSLVRDRLGIKPLYYGRSNGVLLFGSELKALRAHPRFEAEIDRNALGLYFRYNYIPAPYSIFKSVRKVSPGTILTFQSGSLDEPRVEQYWSARSVVEQGVANPATFSEQEAIERLDMLLRSSVRLRLVADVPVGAFLSGGIDSSTIVAMMQSQSSRPVKTFSIGFADKAYDEAPQAKRVAEHLGAEHTELYVSEEHLWETVPSLPGFYDEPFADASQIPTIVLSNLVRQHVTVSLSGDGGDELFGGYNRYFWGSGVERVNKTVPRGLRTAASSLLRGLGPGGMGVAAKVVDGVSPRSMKMRNSQTKLEKFAGMLDCGDKDGIYEMIVSHWKEPHDLVRGMDEGELPTPLNDRSQRADVPGFVRQMMYLDLVTYLTDDVLVKVDRATMGASLEARVPLLDHRVVAFAWQLPLSYKIKGKTGKTVLRNVLERYVPHEMFDRPKAGFDVPVGEWLRGPLRDWAETMLAETRLRDEGYLNVGLVRKLWQDHIDRRQNADQLLWSILMFQAWLSS